MNKQIQAEEEFFAAVENHRNAQAVSERRGTQINSKPFKPYPFPQLKKPMVELVA